MCKKLYWKKFTSWERVGAALQRSGSEFARQRLHWPRRIRSWQKQCFQRFHKPKSATEAGDPMHFGERPIAKISGDLWRSGVASVVFTHWKSLTIQSLSLGEPIMIDFWWVWKWLWIQHMITTGYDFRMVSTVFLHVVLVKQLKIWRHGLRWQRRGANDKHLLQHSAVFSSFHSLPPGHNARCCCAESPLEKTLKHSPEQFSSNKHHRAPMWNGRSNTCQSIQKRV